MIKKLFDWTPRDIAAWEKIQQKGLGKFILWYGMAVTGGLLFLALGIAAVVSWLRRTLGQPITSADWLFLLVQLVLLVLVSCIAGISNSLITWRVEQRLYRKYKARKMQTEVQANQPPDFHG